jgi:hypothetical protein
MYLALLPRIVAHALPAPWLLGAVSAADALVGLLGLDRAEHVGDQRVQGDPRRPGGLPHDLSPIPSLGKANGIAQECIRHTMLPSQSHYKNIEQSASGRNILIKR